MKRHWLHVARTLVCAVPLVIIGACSSDDVDTKVSSSKRVTIDGEQVALGPSIDMSAFRVTASRMAARGGAASVERFVALWPDVALSTIRRSPDDETTRQVSDAYDKVFGNGSAADRQRILAALAEGESGDVSKVEQALAMAKDARFNHIAANTAMLLAIVHQRRADPDAAEARWQEAVRLALDLNDPSLWRRVMDQRPGSARWPQTGPVTDDATALARLADSELRRGDSRQATIDYLRLEPLATTDSLREAARLGRVRALYAQQRVGEAALIVGPLTRSSSPEIARPALALAGVLSAELGDLNHAEDFLARSLKQPTWDGSVRALADLATVQALSGRVDEALGNLRAAQTQFEASEDWGGLHRGLRNEAHMLRFIGRDSEAKALEQRAETLVQEHGLLGE